MTDPTDPPVVHSSWFGHRWSRWTEAQPVGLRTTTGRDITVYQQERTCVECGLTQHRHESILPEAT